MEQPPLPWRQCWHHASAGLLSSTILSTRQQSEQEPHSRPLWRILSAIESTAVCTDTGSDAMWEAFSPSSAECTSLGLPSPAAGLGVLSTLPRRLLSTAARRGVRRHPLPIGAVGEPTRCIARRGAAALASRSRRELRNEALQLCNRNQRATAKPNRVKLIRLKQLEDTSFADT